MQVIVLLLLINSLQSAEIYYQGFNFVLAESNRTILYEKLTADVDGLREANFTGVWLPPPSKSDDLAGYIPSEWFMIKQRAHLEKLTRALSDNGLKVIFDIVLNHRIGLHIDNCTGRYTAFTNPDWDNSRVVRSDWLCSNEEVEVPDDCNPGHFDSGYNACFAPDIDHENEDTREDIVNWLLWLKDAFHADGWRFEMARGYHAKFIKEYINKTEPCFSVGEYIDSRLSGVLTWLAQIDYKIHAFDFQLRYTLQTSIRHNSYHGMMYYLNPPGVMGKFSENAATFVDDHSTARNSRFGNDEQTIMAYAYILTHPGTPFVFYDDWNSEKIREAILPMIEIRHKFNLGETKTLYMDAHGDGLYSVYLGENATCIDCGTVAMKLGTNSWHPPVQSNWLLETSGHDYAIWTK